MMRMRRLYVAVCMAWAAVAWAQEAEVEAAQLLTISKASEVSSSRLPAEALEMEVPTSTLRITSYALWGVSGATALMGTAFALLADNNHRNYKRDYSFDDSARAIRAEVDPLAARKLQDKINAQKTVSIVSFSIAAAAAIGGTTLFFFAPEWQAAKKVQVGVMPMQGGALLSFQGVFP
jgi:hypothetical protein